MPAKADRFPEQVDAPQQLVPAAQAKLERADAAPNVVPLASAVLAKISDDWETERASLTRQARWPDSEDRDSRKRLFYSLNVLIF